MTIYEPIGRAHEPARNHERTDRVVRGPAARIANDMRIALAQSAELCRVHPRIHAGQDCHPAAGSTHQLCLVANVFF
jgi:hypothetical protein